MHIRDWLPINKFVISLNVSNIETETTTIVMFCLQYVTRILCSCHKCTMSREGGVNNVTPTLPSVYNCQLPLVCRRQKDIVSFKLSKRRSWKKIFSHRNSSKKNELSRSNSENGREFDYSADTRLMLDVLPTSSMELIHFVVGHGILRRELRSVRVQRCC